MFDEIARTRGTPRPQTYTVHEIMQNLDADTDFQVMENFVAKRNLSANSEHVYIDPINPTDLPKSRLLPDAFWFYQDKVPSLLATGELRIFLLNGTVTRAICTKPTSNHRMELNVITHHTPLSLLEHLYVVFAFCCGSF